MIKPATTRPACGRRSSATVVTFLPLFVLAMGAGTMAIRRTVTPAPLVSEPPISLSVGGTNETNAIIEGIYIYTRLLGYKPTASEAHPWEAPGTPLAPGSPTTPDDTWKVICHSDGATYLFRVEEKTSRILMVNRDDSPDAGDAPPKHAERITRKEAAQYAERWAKLFVPHLSRPLTSVDMVTRDTFTFYGADSSSAGDSFRIQVNAQDGSLLYYGRSDRRRLP